MNPPAQSGDPCNGTSTTTTATPSTTSLPVWAYWEGPRPPIVTLCLDTAAKHFPTLQVLDPEQIREMGGEGILAATAEHLLPHRADLIRFWVLSRLGGVWFDSDCIVLRPTELHLDITQGGMEASFCRDPQAPKLASFHFAARAGAPMEFALQTCTTVLGSSNFFYDDPSSGILRRVATQFPAQIAIHPDRRYVPLPWREQLQLLSMTANRPHARSLGESAYLFHLGGYVTHAFARVSRERLLSGNWFISHWLRVALGIAQ